MSGRIRMRSTGAVWVFPPTAAGNWDILGYQMLTYSTSTERDGAEFGKWYEHTDTRFSINAMCA
jgi:hypothetical protein